MQFNAVPARWPDGMDFSDITASKVTGPATWVIQGSIIDIPFDVDPSAAEALKITSRIESINANDETLRSAVQAGHANNLTYLGMTLPTSDQVADQVKALTTQVDALIRLQLQDWSGTN